MRGETEYLETANAINSAFFPFYNDDITNRYSIQNYVASDQGQTGAVGISTFYYGRVVP